MPILPEKIKAKPELTTLVNTARGYCNDNKKFILMHYGICKKVCGDDNAKKSIKNILELVSETEEGNKKLDLSVTELKQSAQHVSEVCQKILEVPDDVIKETIEKFCLFVELITKQFV